MAGRITRFEMLPPPLKVVVGRMMRAVGMTKPQIARFRFTGDWYERYTWTRKAHDRFGTWLAKRVNGDAKLKRELTGRSGRLRGGDLVQLWNEIDMLWGWRVGSYIGRTKETKRGQETG